MAVSNDPAMFFAAYPPTWLTVLRRYLAFTVAAHLFWEFTQLPLYTIWYTGSRAEIAFAAIHCTGGDLLIASASLLGALLLAGNARWPSERYFAVAAVAIAAGLAYTMFSEWLNTKVRGSWAYSEFMPVLPFVEIGLSPIAQWIVIPIAGFWLAQRPAARDALGATGR